MKKKYCFFLPLKFLNGCSALHIFFLNWLHSWRHGPGMWECEGWWERARSWGPGCNAGSSDAVSARACRSRTVFSTLLKHLGMWLLAASHYQILPNSLSSSGHSPSLQVFEKANQYFLLSLSFPFSSSTYVSSTSIISLYLICQSHLWSPLSFLSLSRISNGSAFIFLSF